MTLSDAQWNPRDQVVGILDLVNINTPDGDFGFMIGTDGAFTDINGKTWVGSAMLQVGRLQSAIDGVSPSGSLDMAFFQDPDQGELIAEIKELGLDYLNGREATFYWQPLASVEELYAPVLPPQLWLTRIMRRVTYAMTGPLDRRMSLGVESWAESRRSARRITLSTEGHGILIGEANPSLEFMPTSNFQEQRLFG
ncbi:hypothetical protein FHY55_19490 [Oceanicola sp. D3]|uniref:hypothetical protein n=1 Tax=Oceanicola sp. D3 TaxID=2587163 RepID=UPI001120269C|nr:hypothetical protein [Oceanicola sp. D3]QDC11283.1 hypothetical protein FHY55_19490 [Oceanicola sp. D3]